MAQQTSLSLISEGLVLSIMDVTVHNVSSVASCMPSCPSPCHWPRHPPTRATWQPKRSSIAVQYRGSATWSVEKWRAMTASGPAVALSWAAGLLLPLACLTQSPSFSFNPSNYHPPAGEAPASASLLKIIKGEIVLLLLVSSTTVRHSSGTGMKRHRSELYTSSC